MSLTNVNFDSDLDETEIDDKNLKFDLNLSQSTMVTTTRKRMTMSKKLDDGHNGPEIDNNKDDDDEEPVDNDEDDKERLRRRKLIGWILDKVFHSKPEASTDLIGNWYKLKEHVTAGGLKEYFKCVWPRCPSKICHYHIDSNKVSVLTKQCKKKIT